MLVVTCLVVLTACTRGQSDLETWVAKTKAEPAPPLQPLPVMQQFESFEYAAQNMRDPFSPPVPDRNEGSGPRPDPERRKEVLEAFPLDSMNMAGTIGSGKGLVGLVTAPDKVTYRIKPGNYLGQNDGRVTAIYEDRIEIVELVPDGAGGWLERQAKIALEDN
ncbi:MAG: pilus assembly protein PilP [Arenimonas sp.]